jgi:hypothetical protein
VGDAETVTAQDEQHEHEALALRGARTDRFDDGKRPRKAKAEKHHKFQNTHFYFPPVGGALPA